MRDNLPRLSLLAIVCRVFKQLDVPWWRRTWQVSSPTELEHNKNEICSTDGQVIHTPVYGFLGNRCYLPQFVSERYIAKPEVRAFLDVFHNKIIDLWIRFHRHCYAYCKTTSNCHDVYGLKMHIKQKYYAKYKKHLSITIAEFQPEHHQVQSSVLGVCKVRPIISDHCTMRNGIFITINDLRFVDEVYAIANKHCTMYGKVRVSTSKHARIGAVKLGK